MTISLDIVFWVAISFLQRLLKAEHVVSPMMAYLTGLTQMLKALCVLNPVLVHFSHLAPLRTSSSSDSHIYHILEYLLRSEACLDAEV